MSQQGSELTAGTYSSMANDGVKWSMKFDDNGAITITTDGTLAVEGTYTVIGDVLEFSDAGGPWACTGDLKIGTYTWKLEGKKLTFTKVEDKCEGRENALTSQGWEAE